MVDANTKEVLKAGQIDKGHKAGYEERVMRKCAEKVHMSQKDYNKMMQDPRLYQFETSKNNRSHKFESKNYSLQLHNCFEVIRNYQGKHRGRNVKGFEKTAFTRPSKSNMTKSNLSHNKQGQARSISSHGKTGTGMGLNSGSSHGLSGGRSGHGSGGGHGGSSGHGSGSGGHGGSSGHGGR